MRRFLVCVVLLAAGCKKSKTEGTDPGSGTASSAASGSAPVAVDAPAPAEPGSAGSGSAPAAAKLPKEVEELGATLDALVKEPEGEARSKKTCAQQGDIKKKARAVATNKPEGIDQAAWDAANEEIRNALDGLGPYCGEDPPDDSVELPKLHKAYQGVVALFSK